MQPIRVSCVGQTFALARCSDAREKKTRRWRSKEERKTMVDSFIKKYRNSNNGNFPSLNITHKEVGGSFYTVREIVREIIQENKVLGPGDLALQALDLGGRLEENTGGSFSTDPNEIDKEYMGNCALSSEHQIADDKGYDKILETAPHKNDSPFSQIMDDKISNHLDQNLSEYFDENSLNAVYKEANLSAHEISETHEVPLNASDTGNKSNSTAGATKFTPENNAVFDISGTEILPDTKLFSNPGTNNLRAPFQEYSASTVTEVFPLASNATATSSSNRSPLEAEDFTTPLEVFGTHQLSNDQEVASVLVDKDPVAKMKESEEILSSSSINEEQNASTISLSSETLGTMEVEPQLVSQPTDIDNKVIGTNTHFFESPSPDAGETLDISCKAEHDNIANYEKASISSSPPSKKAIEELEKEEINSVWAAVKAFVSAVIKFWT